jgi:mono/diheme cytochrome c family protein
MLPMLRGALVAVLLLALVGGGAALVFLKTTGLSARGTPGALEAAVSRGARAWAVPSDYRQRVNPVPKSQASFRNGMMHFADHCASCHANDGSGATEMGRSLFPPAPDMRSAVTQSLTDGELFYVIEHGIRFTGMPAWGTGTPEGEEASWHLVHFLRRLPTLTPEAVEEMADLNPRSPAEIRQDIEEARFLRGDDASVSPPPAHEHGGN